MKIKELIFVPTGEVRVPDASKDEHYLVNGKLIHVSKGVYGAFARTYPIYKAEERFIEWEPTPNKSYYVPKIDAMGNACYQDYWLNIPPEDSTFMFPTSELAIAQAQKWIDDAKTN